MIKFSSHDHKYESIVPDGVNWISVTSLIGMLQEPFDKESVAIKCSTRKPTAKYPNKWYGLSKEQIIKIWDIENIRALKMGAYYHQQKEYELYELHDPYSKKVIKSVIEEGYKIAPSQIIAEGIYPEHLVYLWSAGVCGQSDYVEVTGDSLYIKDYKTNKEIHRNSFKNWEGISKKMLHPVSHLEDCHINHYTLQLSIYAYIILRHNPSLILKDMTIEHVKFEIESEDKYGYPTYLKDKDGNYIVKEIEELKIPYLKSEVVNIFNWLKTKK
jgi:hypothetical protein